MRLYGLFKFAMAMMLLAAFVVPIAAQQPPSVDATQYRGIYAYSFGLKDADGEVVGDTVWHISATADYDSSLTFDAITWDQIYLQAKFRGGSSELGDGDTAAAADADSNDVVIYALGSLTGGTGVGAWTLVDSLSVTDTAWTFGVITWTKWPWCKFVVVGRADMANEGSVGQIRAGAYGVK